MPRMRAAQAPGQSNVIFQTLGHATCGSRIAPFEALAPVPDELASVSAKPRHHEAAVPNLDLGSGVDSEGEIGSGV